MSAYDNAPDWLRELCLRHVPIDAWESGGLELAARKVERLIKVKLDEDVVRNGLLDMADQGRLVDWLIRKEGP